MTSDSLNSLRGSEASGLDSKKRIAGWVETDKRIFAYQGDKKRSTAQETIIHKPNDQTDALGTAHIPSVVCGLTSGTDTPAKSTAKTSAQKNSLKVTSEKSKQTTFQTVTYSLVDFLAKVSRLQANGKVQENLAERYLRRLLGLRQLKDPAFYCWKTSKASYLQTMAETLPKSFGSWGTWGIYSNGKCLTASGFCLRTERGSSLSDILEEQVDSKYFLSSAMVQRIVKSWKLLEPCKAEDTAEVCTAT